MKTNKSKKSARSSRTKKTAQRRVKAATKPSTTKKNSAPSTSAANTDATGPADTGPVANAALHKVLENIRELQWSGNVRSAEESYGVGEEVQKVEDDPKKYGVTPGLTAVKFLAEKLGCQKDTLYNAVKVVRCWEKKVFCQWLKKVGSKGRQLSFAHFVATATLDDPKGREEMLKKALANNMSTRAVLRDVGGLETKKSKTKHKTRPPLTGLIEATEVALGEWENIDEALADDDADALRLLDRASELQHQLSKRCMENSRALAFRRDSLAASGSIGLEAGELALGAAPEGASLQPVILSASNSHSPAVKQLCSTNPNAEPDPERTDRAPHLETRKASGRRRKLPIFEGVSMPSANSDPAQGGAGGAVPTVESAPDVAGALS